MSLEYVSGSQLNAARCLVKYMKKYINGEKEPTSPALISGLSFHDMAKYNFRQKIQSGGDLSVFELREYLVDNYLQKWESMSDRLQLTEKDEKLGEDNIKHRSIDCLQALVPIFYDRAHSIMPIAVERSMTIDVPGLPKKLKGILDLFHKVAIQSYPGVYVTDFKTSIKPCNWKQKNGSKRPVNGKTAKQAWDDFGLTLYWVMIFTEYGYFPAEMYYDNYLAWINEGEAHVNTAFQRIPTTRTIHHINALFDRIRRLNECIEKMAFYPCSPDDNLCSPDFCGFFNSCEFVWPKDDVEWVDCHKCRNFTGGHRLHCSAKDSEVYNTICQCDFFKKPMTKTEIKALQKKAVKKIVEPTQEAKKECEKAGISFDIK